MRSYFVRLHNIVYNNTIRHIGPIDRHRSRHFRCREHFARRHRLFGWRSILAYRFKSPDIPIGTSECVHVSHRMHTGYRAANARLRAARNST